MINVPLPPGFASLSSSSLLAAVEAAKKKAAQPKVQTPSITLAGNRGQDLYIPDPSTPGGYIRNPNVYIPQGDFEDAVRSLETTASPFTPGASFLPRLSEADFARMEETRRQMERRRERIEAAKQDIKTGMVRRRGRRGLLAPQQSGGGMGFLGRYFS